MEGNDIKKDAMSTILEINAELERNIDYKLGYSTFETITSKQDSTGGADKRDLYKNKNGGKGKKRNKTNRRSRNR